VVIHYEEALYQVYAPLPLPLPSEWEDVLTGISFVAHTSCARGDTICPARCTPDAAAQLQPIPYARGAQRAALLPTAVGAMNINDVRESATIFPRPCKLTFDLLTLKVVSESRVTWCYLCANSGLPRPLCSRVIPDVRDRQTSDRRQTSDSIVSANFRCTLPAIVFLLLAICYTAFEAH